MNKYLYIIILLLVPIAVISFKKGETNFLVEEDSGENDNIVVKVLKDEEYLSVYLEDYVIGVVAGEMPALFENEALKAQAVASRTYIMNHLENSDTIKGSIDDQVYLTEEEMKDKWEDKYQEYYEKIKGAVLATQGEVLKYDDKIIKSYYFSEANGYTESSLNVFNEEKDYLSVQKTEWDEPEEVVSTISKKDFCNLLGISCELLTISDTLKDESNRVSKITINDKTFTGIEIRKLLSLRSTDFTIDVNDDEVVVRTLGYGHGVGMSQRGANNMARNGYKYEEILAFYYQNTEISKI